MSATKKISDRNHIGHVFNKLLKQIGETEEFELPEWLNKGKPTPYIFIRRNIYLTKKFKKRVEDDGIFCSCSSSSPGSSSTLCGRCYSQAVPQVGSVGVGVTTSLSSNGMSRR